MSKKLYEEKCEEFSQLREIRLGVRSDAGTIMDYLRFIAEELIEIKYELKKHGE